MVFLEPGCLSETPNVERKSLSLYIKNVTSKLFLTSASNAQTLKPLLSLRVLIVFVVLCVKPFCLFVFVCCFFVCFVLFSGKPTSQAFTCNPDDSGQAPTAQRSRAGTGDV